MKKTIKKIAALLLAGALAAGMTVAAAAEDTGRTHNLTNRGNADVSAHSYVAYQLLKADSIEDGKYGNIAWADNVDSTARAALLAVGPYTDVEALVEGVQRNDSAKAVALADAAYANMDRLGTAQTVVNGETQLGLGLWVIVDTSTAADVDVVNLANLFASDGTTPVSIVSKVDTITVEKKVKDINDSEDTTYTGWQDSADHDVGDTVPFQLKATLPANYTDYDEYHLTFHDVQSSGLTFKEIVSVTIDGTTVDSENYSFIEDPDDDCTFEIAFSDDDLKAINADNSSVILIEYNSEVNSNAVMGSTGNPNDVYLTYSNDANSAGEGTTAPDRVIVFTYKVIVNKVDENKEPLQGAGFTLYKKNTDGEFEAIGEELKGGEMTQFKWERLDDGDYKLSETTTPPSYNTIEDILFTITADHDLVSDSPALNSLNGVESTGEITLVGTQKANVNTADGSIVTGIENQKGSTLPSTGGMGTTIFYVIGGILILAAAIILISRRRVQQ